jgi:hypothetical protein
MLALGARFGDRTPVSSTRPQVRPRRHRTHQLGKVFGVQGGHRTSRPVLVEIMIEREANASMGLALN